MTGETPEGAPQAHTTYIKTITRYFGNEVRRIAFQGSPARRSCSHVTAAQPLPPAVLGCPTCIRDSTTWVKLRMCLTCGSVGCCDTSIGRHAVGHFEATRHPVMRSIDPSDTWGWCYLDKAYLAVVTA